MAYGRQLAEAVNRYAAALEKLAATNGEASADNQSSGRAA